MKLNTLRKRREFLRIRGGGRWSTRAFVLETKERPDTPDIRQQTSGALAGTARFGFTVTKRLGNAVKRNRIRRRLRAALTEVASAHANATFDYVLIARDAAHDLPFAELTKLMSTAFERVHRAPATTRKRDGGRPKQATSKLAKTPAKRVTMRE